MRTLIVPISGGKDSQVILSLALAEVKRTGQKRICVHQNTGYDHPITLRHLTSMAEFYNVQIDHTISKYRNMFGLLEKIQYFPSQSARGCTSRLKQEPFLAWLQEKGFNNDNCEIWFGMRADESQARSTKYGGKTASEQMPLTDISQFYGHTKELLNTVGNIPCYLPVLDWKVTRDICASRRRRRTHKSTIR